MVSQFMNALNSNKKILVADDEFSIREYVSENLLIRGFQVVTAATGAETLALFKSEHPDLIILDIMMPNMDGFETCRRIRQTSTVPVIMLTALNEDEDKIRALDLGADDYLTKPFSVDVLMAHVRAVFRRTQWHSSSADAPQQVIRFRDLELFQDKGAVYCRGELVKLSRTEYALLHFFMHHLGELLSHEDILQEIWGDSHNFQADYLRVYIGRLRRKIEADPSRPEYLISEYGAGYRFGTSIE